MRIARCFALLASSLAFGCAGDQGQKPAGEVIAELPKQGAPAPTLPAPPPKPSKPAAPGQLKPPEQAAQSARDLRAPNVVALRDTDAGRMLDNQDMLLAIKAEREAMQKGKASWANQDNGRSGSVFGMQEFEAQGKRCRNYVHEFVVDGSRRTVQRSICARNGEWIIDS